MHITFINTCLGGDYSALDIAITSLATFVNERTRHSASIVDLTFHRRFWKRYLCSELALHKPDVVGISSNTMYMQYVKMIMAEVKQAFALPIVLGGHHASIYPEATLRLDGCDYVCTGDGERPLELLLDRLEEQKSVDGVKGIWHKKDDSIIKNEIGCFYQLDNLPMPNWDLWKDLDKYLYYLGMLYVIGSRGCPYTCTFCDAHGIAKAIPGSYYRERDPYDYVQELMTQWEKYGQRNLRLFQLFDPVFTMNTKWVELFCSEYRRLGLHEKIKYSVFSRIDHLDEDKINMLADSGCGVVRIGVECGNEYIRNHIYEKKLSDKKLFKIFDLLHKRGVTITAYYMLGGPGESHTTMRETIVCARKLQAQRSVFFMYKPFTDEGVKQVVEYGGIVDQKRWKKADNITFSAVVRIKGVPPLVIEMYQWYGYAVTFTPRLVKMICRLKWMYPVYLSIYLFSAIIDGLNLSYVLMYFHVYGYDNIDK
ncbi:B12-binding domain-containing radical SAM protein [Candidatus Omnitrophota bacterium]